MAARWCRFAKLSSCADEHARALAENPGKALQLYAVDHDYLENGVSKRAKRFDFGAPAELHAMLSQLEDAARRCFYEVVEPCRTVRLFLNVNLDVSAFDEIHSATAMDDIAAALLTSARRHLYAAFPGRWDASRTDHELDDILLLNSCSPTRLSFRALFRSVIFDDAASSMRSYVQEFVSWTRERVAVASTQGYARVLEDDQVLRGYDLLAAIDPTLSCVNLSAYSQNTPVLLAGNCQRGTRLFLVPQAVRIQGRSVRVLPATLELQCPAFDLSLAEFGGCLITVTNPFVKPLHVCPCASASVGAIVRHAELVAGASTHSDEMSRNVRTRAESADLMPLIRRLAAKHVFGALISNQPVASPTETRSHETADAQLKALLVCALQRSTPETAATVDAILRVKAMHIRRVETGDCSTGRGGTGASFSIDGGQQLWTEDSALVPAASLSAGDIVYCQRCEADYYAAQPTVVPSATVFCSNSGELGCYCYHCGATSWIVDTADHFGFRPELHERIVLQPGIKYLNEAGARGLGELDVPLHQSHRLFIVDAPMGRGKTTIVAQYISSLPATARVLAISSRVASTQHLAQLFKLTCYKDVSSLGWTSAATDRLAICASSLQRLHATRYKYDLVIVDDATLVRHSFVCSTNEPRWRQMLAAFRQILGVSRKVVAMQFRMTEEDLAFYAQMCRVPLDRSPAAASPESARQVLVCKLESPPTLCPIRVVDSPMVAAAAVAQKYVDSFDVGLGVAREPIIIFCTRFPFAAFLEFALQKLARDRYGQAAAARVRGLWVAGSRGVLNGGFVENPQEYAASADILIVPSMSLAGLSFEPRFTVCVDLLFSNVHSFREELQLTGRLRLLDRPVTAPRLMRLAYIENGTADHEIPVRSTVQSHNVSSRAALYANAHSTSDMAVFNAISASQAAELRVSFRRHCWLWRREYAAAGQAADWSMYEGAGGRSEFVRCVTGKDVSELSRGCSVEALGSTLAAFQEEGCGRSMSFKFLESAGCTREPSRDDAVIRPVGYRAEPSSVENRDAEQSSAVTSRASSAGAAAPNTFHMSAFANIVACADRATAAHVLAVIARDVALNSRKEIRAFLDPFENFVALCDCLLFMGYGHAENAASYWLERESRYLRGTSGVAAPYVRYIACPVLLALHQRVPNEQWDVVFREWRSIPPGSVDNGNIGRYWRHLVSINERVAVSTLGSRSLCEKLGNTRATFQAVGAPVISNRVLFNRLMRRFGIIIDTHQHRRVVLDGAVFARLFCGAKCLISDGHFAAIASLMSAPLSKQMQDSWARAAAVPRPASRRPATFPLTPSASMPIM